MAVIARYGTGGGNTPIVLMTYDDDDGGDENHIPESNRNT